MSRKMIHFQLVGYVLKSLLTKYFSLLTIDFQRNSDNHAFSIENACTTRYSVKNMTTRFYKISHQNKFEY